jgi:glycosyltransferase involved in cell wall biosynthesis
MYNLENYQISIEDKVLKAGCIARSLIYESGETGHRAEYVSHLMKYIINKPELHGKYTFILNAKIKRRLGQLAKVDAYNIKYIEVSRKYSNSIERSFSEWQLVAKLVRQDAQYAEIIFLDIDPFLILLTTKQFKRFNMSVKGILFEPYHHFKEKNGGLWFFFRHTLRSYLFQKYATYSNSKIRRLFILNDEKCIPSMNKDIKDVFSFLPDPIEIDLKEIEPELVEIIKAKYAIKPGRKNLLLFGSIDCRKNLVRIINSLLLMPASVRRDIHFIVAGKFHAEAKTRYIEHIEKHAGVLSISYQDEFVSDEEREVLFQESEIVLMPYTNFYSSSGILGHTIKHNKIVVASNTGLVSRIVKENNLGITVDPLNEHEIKEAIMRILNKDAAYNYSSNKLLEKFAPNSFSETLLAN